MLLWFAVICRAWLRIVELIPVFVVEFIQRFQAT